MVGEDLELFFGMGDISETDGDPEMNNDSETAGDPGIDSFCEVEGNANMETTSEPSLEQRAEEELPGGITALPEDVFQKPKSPSSEVEALV